MQKRKNSNEQNKNFLKDRIQQCWASTYWSLSQKEKMCPYISSYVFILVDNFFLENWSNWKNIGQLKIGGIKIPLF